jgi:lysophospholipase L1-like esterase
MKQGNLLIKTFLSLQAHAHFIDIWSDMLNADGTGKKELYEPDMLHMKANGYAIWQKAIAPYLSK